MLKETNQTNVDKDDLMFHFVPEIGENTMDINEEVKQYVKNFFEKICVDFNPKPNSIGLIGDLPTLINILGRLVQDYEKYRGLDEEFILN